MISFQQTNDQIKMKSGIIEIVTDDEDAQRLCQETEAFFQSKVQEALERKS